jgi:hypothetical protein
MATLQVTNLKNIAAGANTNVSLLADGSTTLVLNATGTARTGGIRYNAGALEVYNGTVWAPIGGLAAATLAQAAAGTLNTVANTPQTSVPKDAAGMTGAAIIPSGTDAQRAAITTPVVGMQRFNTDTGYEEVYTGTTKGWQRLSFVSPFPFPLADLNITANGDLPSGVYNNITIAAGVTVTAKGLVRLTAYGSVTINGTIDGNSNGYTGFTLVTTSISGALISQLGLGMGAGRGQGLPGFSYSWRQLLSSSGSTGNIGSLDTTGSARSNGGSAGASLIVTAQGPVVIGSTATITMNGQSGGANSLGNSGSGGGGGGAGGLILLESKTSLNLAAGSVLSCNGGSGGNGVRAGTITNAGGGGGGGGGYIVLNSLSTSDSATKTVSPGAGGALVSTGGNQGGGGAGFGGAGGEQGNVSPAAPGSAGQIIFNDYLL